MEKKIDFNDSLNQEVEVSKNQLKVKAYHAYLVDWLRKWFDENGKDCNAIVGISGGKDSTVVAALCVEALGPDRVFGVLMPNGTQNDINDSYEVVKYLGIRSVLINIEEAYNSILNQFTDNACLHCGVSEQTKINLAPRLRMSTLYAVSQSLNGRVVGTSNLSESALGYFTRWGDGVADVEPIINLFVSEVVALGLEIGLPEHLVKKTPSDGLCGLSDEDKMGFTYAEFEEWYKDNSHIYTNLTNNDKEEMMKNCVLRNTFKNAAIPHPDKGMSNFTI